MIIKYGLNDDNIDVTSICYDKLRSDNLIVIPNSDHTRAKYFTDPYYGKLKSIFIISETDIINQIEYDHTKTIYIDTKLNKVLLNDEKLLSIHNNLKLKIDRWSGRLGNNIKQLRNVLAIGIYYGYNIEIPKHKFFNKTYIEITKEAKNNTEIFIDNEGRNFFDSYKITHFPQNIYKLNQEIVKRILLDLFTIKYDKLNKLDNDDVVIHIRSGDIFHDNIHRLYICPPLCYYTDIIKKNNFKSIYLVAEDTRNPCINKLLELYPKIIFKINKLEDDIKIILSAVNVIQSCGTFISSLSYLTNNIKKIYVPHYHTEYAHYISLMKPWKNTKEQLNLMLNYKKDNL